MNHLSRKTLFIILSVMSAVILVLTGLVIGLSLGRAGKDADAAQPPTEKEALAETSGTLSAEPEQTLPESTEEPESGLKEKALMEVPTLPAPPETEREGGGETEKEVSGETEPAVTQKQKEDRPETVPAATEEHPGGTENKESLPEETRPEETAPKETKEKKTEPAETEPRETKEKETKPAEQDPEMTEPEGTAFPGETGSEDNPYETQDSHGNGSEEDETGEAPVSEPEIPQETSADVTESQTQNSEESSRETLEEEMYREVTPYLLDVFKGGYYYQDRYDNHFYPLEARSSYWEIDPDDPATNTYTHEITFYANGRLLGFQHIMDLTAREALCYLSPIYEKK